VWLNLIGYHIAKRTSKYFKNSKKYPYFANQMSSCLPEDVIKLAKDLKDAVYEPEAKECIMILVRKWSVEISLNSLENCQASRFYKSMLNNQSGFVQDLRMLSSMRWSGGEALECTRKACKFPSKGWDISRTYDYYTTLNENRLIHMLEILRELRKSIAVAAQSSYIHTELLAKLKMRLQEFDRDSLYSLACSYVAWGSLQEPSLVQADSKTWWLDTLANPLEL
jgi:BioD-like phosphotransacetylase family protein